MVSYKERLGQELEGWKRFREALLADERASFDSMVNYSLKYARSTEAYGDRGPSTYCSCHPYYRMKRDLEDNLKVRIRLDKRLDEDWPY